MCRRFSVVMELITAETTPTRNTVSAAIYSCSSHLVSIKKSRKKSSKTGGVLCVHACVCACLGIYIHGYITYLPTYIYIYIHTLPGCMTQLKCLYLLFSILPLFSIVFHTELTHRKTSFFH